jgi:hypothetical protein
VLRQVDATSCLPAAGCTAKNDGPAVAEGRNERSKRAPRLRVPSENAGRTLPDRNATIATVIQPAAAADSPLNTDQIASTAAGTSSVTSLK